MKIEIMIKHISIILISVNRLCDLCLWKPFCIPVHVAIIHPYYITVWGFLTFTSGDFLLEFFGIQLGDMQATCSTIEAQSLILNTGGVLEIKLKGIYKDGCEL